MQHPRRRRRRRFQPVDAPARSVTRGVALLVLVGLTALLAACSGTGDDRAVATTTLPDTVPPELAVGANVTVPVTLPIPDNFIAPDTRGALIPPVLSKVKDYDHSRPILPVEGGTSRITGVVFGPEGPVEGAIVRLERFVGPDFGQLDVATNKDGRYTADNILGGRYRIRAWQKPALATLEPPALFLAADHAEREMNIVTEKFEGESLQGALDVADPHVRQKVTFRALLSRDEVNDDGIVVGAGIEGHDVQLTPVDGGMSVDGPDVQRTGADGMAIFTLVCEREGVHSVIIGSGDKALAIGLPNCLPGELTLEDVLGTTTTAPPTTAAPTTTRPPATTTPTTRPTTAPPTTRPTTTSTTRPRNP